MNNQVPEGCVRLKRNSWHRRLQKFIFGKRVPEFRNLCPHFWLTAFCLLPFVLIPVTLLKGFIFILTKVIDVLIGKLLDPRFISWAENLNEETIYRMKKNLLHSMPYYSKHIDYDDVIDLFFKKKGITDKEERTSFIDKIRKKYDYIYEARRLEKRRKEKERYDKRVDALSRKSDFKKQISDYAYEFSVNYSDVIVYTKKFISFLITAAVTIFSYFLYKWSFFGLAWVVFNTTTLVWIKVLFGLIGIIIAVVLIILIIFLGERIKTYIDNNNKSDAVKNFFMWCLPYPFYYAICIPVYYIFYKWIYMALKWIVIFIALSIVKTCKIFGEYFGAAYGDYCKGIVWDNEEE
jgi:hypothetical protein